MIAQNFLTPYILLIPHFLNTQFFHKQNFLVRHYFDHSVFTGLAEFGGAKFSGEASFDEATFLNYAGFAVSNFSHGAHFNYASFADWGNFSEAIFKAKSCLSLMHITLRDSSNLAFYDTVLPDTIYFSDNGKIKNAIDFSRANFTDTSRYDYNLKQPKPIWIYLYNSDIAKLHLDYVHYKLLLPDSTIIIPNISTNERKRFITPDEKSSMHEALLNNFKTNGQTESLNYWMLNIRNLNGSIHGHTGYPASLKTGGTLVTIKNIFSGGRFCCYLYLPVSHSFIYTV